MGRILTAAVATRAGAILRAAMPSLIGLASLALIVLGVWGLAGWAWASIAAGSVPAAFYVYGQWRLLQGPSGGK